jgi:hypothetical protein
MEIPPLIKRLEQAKACARPVNKRFLTIPAVTEQCCKQTNPLVDGKPLFTIDGDYTNSNGPICRLLQRRPDGVTGRERPKQPASPGGYTTEAEHGRIL